MNSVTSLLVYSSFPSASPSSPLPLPLPSPFPLPFPLLSQLLLRLLAIILTAAASNYWVLIPAAIVMVVLLALRWYYLKTSREVKRLEAIGQLGGWDLIDFI